MIDRGRARRASASLPLGILRSLGLDGRAERLIRSPVVHLVAALCLVPEADAHKLRCRPLAVEGDETAERGSGHAAVGEVGRTPRPRDRPERDGITEARAILESDDLRVAVEPIVHAEPRHAILRSSADVSSSSSHEPPPRPHTTQA